MGDVVSRLPVLDVGPLLGNSTDADRAEVCARIGRACRDTGFFYVLGHGVDEDLQAELESLSREFFALPLSEKLAVRMELAGTAWRGYFPLGAELTSGRPDLKEGLYCGIELPPGDPRVRAGLPLHGANLFPALPAGLGLVVLAYTAALTRLGHALMSGIAGSLGLEPDWFAERYTADPVTLFRIFNYPATEDAQDAWGVGEHTDYGLLTILRQDGNAGLQVRTRDGSGWIDAPPLPGSFVCNLGDMLDRLTGGHYRSTPHRVVPSAGRDRLSWPFFFDPSWDADIRPVGQGALTALAAPDDDAASRWDAASVHEFLGTYGDYLTAKVAKVFPDLR